MSIQTDNYWNRRLNDLKERFGLESEVELSSAVGISPAMLGHVRSGRRSLPVPARARLLDKLGYVLTRDLLLRLLPNDVSQTIADIDNKRLLPPGGDEPNAGLELPPSETDE